ncbi:MAG: DNA cytosine methyltransferase [Paraclostridium sp.]
MGDRLRVLSLFDGISCGRVALERLGIEVDKYDAYEIDENAIKVSKYNYPNIVQKGDVFGATYEEGEYDLLIGGSPCTHWSIAKAGGCRETTSSGVGWELFMQYVRALNEVEPKYFLYENNFSMSDDIKNEITKQLKVEPIMIDSADFSAQQRKRYYWTNIPVDLSYEKSALVLDDILYEHDYRVRDFTKYKDNTICRYDSSGKGYYSQASRCRKTSIKSNTLTASGNDKNNIYVGECKCRNIHPIEAERLQTLPDDYTDCLNSKVKRSEVCGNGWTVDVIVHILKGIK